MKSPIQSRSRRLITIDESRMRQIMETQRRVAREMVEEARKMRKLATKMRKTLRRSA